MPNKRQKYDEEFKKNAVRLSFASNRTFRQTADDLGIEVSMLYRWRKRYTPEGEKTQYTTLEEEYRALRLEIAEKYGPCYQSHRRDKTYQADVADSAGYFLSKMPEDQGNKENSRRAQLNVEEFYASQDIPQSKDKKQNFYRTQKKRPLGKNKILRRFSDTAVVFYIKKALIKNFCMSKIIILRRSIQETCLPLVFGYF